MSAGVNVEGLRALYREDGVARIFLDHAAHRERDRTETTVDRTLAILRENETDSTRGDVVGLFQRLEGLGCGKFIVGRRGRQSRFAWSASITDTGRAAVGEQQTVAEIPETSPVANEDSIESLTHTYHLRPDTLISVELPADLTTHEAERLASYIKSLPMEE